MPQPVVDVRAEQASAARGAGLPTQVDRQELLPAVTADPAADPAAAAADVNQVGLCGFTHTLS